MNDIDRQIKSINIATKALKEHFGKSYELGALTNSIPLLEELRELRKEKGQVLKVPIATIKFSKKELQEIVDEKIEMFQTDIRATRNKAIDEMAEKICVRLCELSFTTTMSGLRADILTLDNALEEVCEIAKQMKEGE